MTDEQINIKIAELCGWKPHPLCTDMQGKPWPSEPPNYAADLNACHEFEIGLASTQCAAYRDCLSQNPDIFDAGFGGCIDWCLVHATARQRCKAFLRVHGQWEEEA